MEKGTGMSAQHEVVTRDQPGGAVAVTSEAASFIQMIERASKDPNVDIDKMERLTQMLERMINRQAETAFNAALAAVQTELPVIPERGKIKNRDGKVQSTYALWEDLNEIIKPILSRHGFALTFRTGNDGPKMIVTGVLSHASGHSVSSTMILPMDSSGSKNEVQGLGSSTSYGKRYVAGALLNLTSRDEDNDGAGSKLMPESERSDWHAAIDGLGSRGEAEALWKRIAGSCTAYGDVAAYDALKGAFSKKLHSLKEPQA
jgi:hypothetical protein